MTLHVLLDVRLQRGGLRRYGRTLLEGLARAAPTVRAERLAVESRLQRVTRTPLTPWGRLSLRRAVRRYDADLLHATHLELPRLTSVACVVTILDLIPLEHPASMPSRMRRAAYRRLVDASLERATRIVTASEASAGALRRHGADPAKLRVVPLAVDSRFRPSSESERGEARRRFAAGRPYVAASVTAKAHKNAPLLAAAAAILRRRTGVPVISSGEPLDGLDWVRFTGPISDAELRSLYGGAEAVVVPSLVEGFGLPAAEALACGVPVVCGPGLGALAYLRPGALVVDVEDRQSLADELQRIVEDEGYRRRLGAAGRRAAAALSIESMAAATADVYRDAVACFSKSHAVTGGAQGRSRY